MRQKIVIYIVVLTTTAFGQKNFSDTLFIGKHKFRLEKASVFYPNIQPATILLPSEYKQEGAKKTVSFKCTDRKQYHYLISPDEGYDEQVVSASNSPNCLPSEMALYSYIDSIPLDYTKNEINIYIKSKNKRIDFCALTAYIISNDTLTYYNLTNRLDIPRLSKSVSGQSPISENAICLIQNLYYRRGNTTYFLDRSFILKIK
ncbi:hypothetical protein CNR22_16120 [Sphingobacteriaceae bacterium]|nr:hypothetical protein CNR22_16120 [Sphingobacteriaceae bacterium]